METSGFPGNIRVFCRVRPVSPEQQDSADARTLLSFDSDDDAVLHLTSRGKVMTFELDRIFPPPATQEEVRGPGHMTTAGSHDQVWVT